MEPGPPDFNDRRQSNRAAMGQRDLYDHRKRQSHSSSPKCSPQHGPFAPRRGRAGCFSTATTSSSTPGRPLPEPRQLQFYHPRMGNPASRAEIQATLLKLFTLSTAEKKVVAWRNRNRRANPTASLRPIFRQIPRQFRMTRRFLPSIWGKVQ